MFRKTTLAIGFVLCFSSAFAQDSIPKITRQYVGVQVNQLIRQILNFGGSAAVNNPYLLTYAVNSRSTGWGANFGLGYTFNEFKDGDAFTQRSTKINEFYFRIGFEEKSRFGKHWIISAGVDAIAELKNNSTTTRQGDPGAPEFKTKNKSNGFGLGPRVTLNYELTDKILLGTEVTYYFKSTTNKITNSGGFGPSSDTEEKFKSFQFNSPTVLFLILKF
jgi:hypothetical protein